MSSQFSSERWVELDTQRKLLKFLIRSFIISGHAGCSSFLITYYKLFIKTSFMSLSLSVNTYLLVLLSLVYLFLSLLVFLFLVLFHSLLFLLLLYFLFLSFSFCFSPPSLLLISFFCYLIISRNYSITLPTGYKSTNCKRL